MGSYGQSYGALKDRAVRVLWCIRVNSWSHDTKCNPYCTFIPRRAQDERNKGDASLSLIKGYALISYNGEACPYNVAPIENPSKLAILLGFIILKQIYRLVVLR